MQFWTHYLHTRYPKSNHHFGFCLCIIFLQLVSVFLHYPWFVNMKYPGFSIQKPYLTLRINHLASPSLPPKLCNFSSHTYAHADADARPLSLNYKQGLCVTTYFFPTICKIDSIDKLFGRSIGKPRALSQMS